MSISSYLDILRKTCKELDIKIIDMAVNPDHVHLFIYSISPKVFRKLYCKDAQR
ncbi:MAG: transposase [Methanosarcinales archaeon]|nr:transposase [Methanosarcinales archaeon]